MNSDPITSAQLPWEPVVFGGRTIDGIYTKTLRYDQSGKRPIRLLLRLDAGATYPEHNYPGGDDIYVLQGEVRYGDLLLKKDEYLFAPANPGLVVSSSTGCIMFYALSK